MPKDNPNVGSRFFSAALQTLHSFRIEISQKMSSAVIALLLLTVTVTGAFFGLSSTRVQAQTPNTTMNYQARILNSDGSLVADGNYHIEFKIYDTVSAGATAQGVCSGNCLWAETRTTGNLVRVVNGYVTVNLGSVTAFPSNMPWGQDLYVTMRIGGAGGAASWDTEMTNSGNRMKITAVPLAFAANNVLSGDTNAASTNTNTISIQTGNALGTTSNSGSITIDTGSATGTTGTIVLGATNASGITLGRTGLTTSNAGSLTVTQLLTASGGATIATGSTFTNASSTLFTAQAVADKPAGGAIGTAAATVDVATTFNITQTTAGQTLTLPAPTVATAGRLVFVNNSGSASFTMYGTTLGAGASNSFMWNGSSWVTSISLSSSVVNTIGTIDSQTKSSDGAVISGNAIYLQTADASSVGLVSTGSQTFAGDKTFNGSVVLAASQSLTVTGGNTASRPGSPTEGMVYFDTTTDSLLTYANGKWQSDRGEYVVVAANDSSQAEKDSADYVADGTGDQTEINSALTDAAGGKVILLAGTYSISASISVPNNTTLAGTGAGTLITIPNAQNGSYAMITNTTTGGSGTGVVVRDLKVDGNKANQTSGIMGSGIYFNGMGGGSVMGGTITGVSVGNVYDAVGIYLVSSVNNIVSDSTVYDNPNGGIYINGGSYNTVTGNNFNNIPSGGVRLSSTSYNSITGNTASNSYVGIDLAASSYNSITGNTVNYNTTSGIEIAGSSDNNTITGNTTNYNYQGVYLGSSTNNTATGNTANYNTFGLYIDTATATTITGNTANNNTNLGIYFAGSTGNTITSNTANSNANFGVAFNGSSNNNFAANYVNGNGSGGVSLYGSSNYNTVSANSFINNGAAGANEGIHLSSASYNSITGNIITDSSCATNCYAIDIVSGTGNYLADNTYYTTAGTDQATINDAGTGTRYASQLTPAAVLQSGSSLIKANTTTVLTGSIDPAASTTVPGVGTKFTTELQVGDRITVTGETRTVTAIASDTSLTVDTAFSNNANDVAPDRLPAALRIANSSGVNQLLVQDNGNVSASGQLLVNGTGANQSQLIVRANSGQTVANPLVLLQDSSAVELARINVTTSSLYFGNAAGGNSAAGVNNTGIGASALGSVLTGTGNTTLGSGALASVSVSDNNTAVGYNAGNLATGGNNIFLGALAGDNVTTGTDNIIIGYNLNASGAGVSNELRIGGVLQGSTSTLAAQFNGTLAITTLGTTDNASFICRNSSNILAGCNYAPLSSSLADNTTDALDIQEGTNNYININTTDGSENISFGNATDNPTYEFLGSGGLTVGGSATIAGDLDVDSGQFTVNSTPYNIGDPYGYTSVNGTLVLNNDTTADNAVSLTGGLMVDDPTGTPVGYQGAYIYSNIYSNVNSLDFSGVNSTGIIGSSSLGAELTDVNSLIGIEASAGLAFTATGSTAVNAIALHALDTYLAAGTVDNGYGLFVDNQTGATDNYGVYIAGASTYALWVDTGATRLDGTLEVQGLTTLSGGLTVEAGDTFTFNGDAFTDLTGAGLVVSSNALTLDITSATGAFVNGGNSFAGTATLGTNDANILSLETTNTSRFQVAAASSTLTGQGATILTSTAGLTVDSAAALSLGITNATSIAVGKSGITTTITGGLTQLTGAVSLTGNGASTFTTSAGALTLTSAAAATWSTAAGALTVDSAAALNLGTTNATSVSLGKSGITTTNNGALTVTQLLTGNLGATVSGAAISLNDSSNFATTINTGTSTGNVTIGNSSNAGNTITLVAGATNGIRLQSSNVTIGAAAGSGTLTNNGSTKNTVSALGDLAAGAIGTAAATVDVYTSFTISPTASGRTYTIPAPTDGAAGRTIYVSNINATNTFLIGSTTFGTHSTATLVYDGTSWNFAGMDGGSSNYIQNQSSSDQVASFRIAGTGQISPTANSAVALTVNGTSGTAATALVVAQTGVANGINITSSNASQVSSSALSVTQSGTTTGFTGNFVNFVGSSTTGAGNLLNLTSVNTTAGNALNVTANALTTGDAVDINHSTTVMTSGALLRLSSSAVDTFTTGGLAVISSSTNFTSTANTAGLLNVSATASAAGTNVNIANSFATQTTSTLLNVVQSGTTTGYTGNVASITGSGTTGAGNVLKVTGVNTTAGNVVNVTANGITTGNGVNINHTTSAITTGSLLTVNSTATDAFTTGALATITSSGNFTSTANTAGLLNVTASATTAGTLVNIASSAAGQTASTLLNVVASGYTTGYTGNVASFTGVSTTGASNVLNVSSANTTAGNALNVTANGLTTGDAVDINHTTAVMTTGALLRLSSTSVDAFSAGGGLVDVLSSAAFTSTANAGLVNIRANNASQVSGTLLNVLQTGVTTGYTGNVVAITGASTTGSGNTLSVTGVNTTAGNTVNVTNNAITTGNGVNINHTTSAITTGSLLTVNSTATDAFTTGALATITSSGNFTSTANTAGLLNVTATATTAGTLVNIASSSAGQTASTLLNVVASGYTTGYTGNVASFTGVSTTGASNVLNVSSANTTAGNALNVTANGLTTGAGLNVNSTGTLTTTGTLATFTANSATTATGVVSISATGLTTGSALKVTSNSTANAILSNGNITFGELTGTRTLGVEARTAAATAGTALTVRAGSASASGAATAGGTLTLQGGSANGASATANGGNVVIAGGTGYSTGVKGLVVIDTATYSAAAVQNFTADANITQASIDTYGSILISGDVPGWIATMTDPTQTTAGRVIYVTNSGSEDITLGANTVGVALSITLKPGSTATMYWNGTDWTAAGASSSTDLQAAYDNTATSAGGAEIVLSSTGTGGLTIRNNDTTAITGGLLEVQTSIGSNLFTVNNNATEYASNGGAESATFTAWAAAPAGGTVTRYATIGNNIATGVGSAFVDTTSTINTGAKNTLSASLTANLRYKVSYTARHTSSTATFTTLETYYSNDGTTAHMECGSDATIYYNKWTRVDCTFTPTSVGASNAFIFRHADAVEHDFYIDNFSVTVDASSNHAVDGNVDAALGTNWQAYDADGGAGTSTPTLDTTNIYNTSGAVAVATAGPAANLGVRNNMAISPSISTQYLVTFYAKLASGTFTDITVGFLPAGGNSTPIAAQLCTDYNTQTLSTSSWTKITCIMTTPSAGISDPDLVIYQPTSGARTFYVDALSITLNTNNSSNVQVGGGQKGGPTTLFTLDRSYGAPIADNNDGYLGSMYYDTSTGRIQCYEADGWGACGAAPDNIVNLNPEYAGAVLNGTGVGTMTADFCSDDTALTVNATLCETGQAKNFYKWTSPQATSQTYSIYVTYQLPATFNGFSSDDTVQLTGRVDNTTNASVTYEMYKSTGSAVTQCGTGETNVITGGGGVADTWYTYGVNGNESTGCSFSSSSASNFIIFKINMKANSNATAYVSTLSFTTTGR